MPRLKGQVIQTKIGHLVCLLFSDSSEGLWPPWRCYAPDDVIYNQVFASLSKGKSKGTVLFFNVSQIKFDVD